ncbi:MAG: hydrogenase maturation nickel metallochaperone HypA [Bacillota bacterium]|nr:hydrogenase maturation nickel metallochaperone HypA [Bacillota bacterium]
MHEYPLTQKIIKIAEKYALEHKADHVSKINLVIGNDSGVLADSILLYFEIIAENTICENAEIVIERVKPLLKCKKCGQYFERKPFSFSCTFKDCGGDGEPTEIGREFYVKSIEIE